MALKRCPCRDDVYSWKAVAGLRVFGPPPMPMRVSRCTRVGLNPLRQHITKASVGLKLDTVRQGEGVPSMATSESALSSSPAPGHKALAMHASSVRTGCTWPLMPACGYQSVVMMMGASTPSRRTDAHL